MLAQFANLKVVSPTQVKLGLSRWAKMQTYVFDKANIGGKMGTYLERIGEDGYIF